MSDPAIPSPSAPDAVSDEASAPTGMTIPFHAPDAVARLLDAIGRHGVVMPDREGTQEAEALLLMLAPALRDMEGTVSHVDRLVGHDPSQPLHGSWTIVWSDGNETTVAIDHDGDATAMDATGTRWHRVGSNGLRLVTVRHVRRVVGGAVLSLSAVVDAARLDMPDDHGDGRRPIHVARTVTALIAAAAARLVDPFGRFAPPSHETETDPVHVDHTTQTIPSTDHDLAVLAGIATLLDAGREDLLSLLPNEPSATVRMRRPGALAPGFCIVGGPYADAIPHAIPHAEPDALPPQPTNLAASVRNDPGARIAYAVAGISNPQVEADLGGLDPLQIMRLARLASPWRTTRETRP